MATQWQPYQEPIRSTIVRNIIITLVVGVVVAQFWGGFARLPIILLTMLWPTFGGHALEVWYLNRLRPRLPMARGIQIIARIGVWLIGGIGLLVLMRFTAAALGGARQARWPAWWVGGMAFVGIELIAHLGLLLRGRPNFYDGQG